MKLLKWTFLLLSIAAMLARDVPVQTDHDPPVISRNSTIVVQAEFDRWLAASPARAGQYQEFVAYLDAQGVGDVLPPWSLLVPDRQYMSARCQIDLFVIPPKALWPNVVPSLRVLRADIIPVVGPVRISSAYRPSAFNACIGGAKKSAHLSFSAFDLVTTTPVDRDILFGKLCRVWRAKPAAAKMGLGAYYNAAKPTVNPIGRFHIDTLGKRTWGSDFRSGSSFCNA
jgi:Peptidase M15